LKKNNTTSNSVKWNAINSAVSQGTTIITGVVLMRVLEPKAFGLIGMITVFTGFLNIIKDSGLASSLIYKKFLQKIDKDTVFWFNIVVGFVLTLGFFFSSSFIAKYYEEPILNQLVKAFSVTFFLSAISITQYTLFKKNLAFKKIFKVEIIGLLLSAILTIVAALMGFGVWSLVILQISKTLIISINTWIFSSYKPSFNFSYSVLMEHFQYSFPVLGTKSFNYWTRNADNFFIGSFLGSQALAYYSRAYFFVAMPAQKISGIIGNVLFPSLSKIKDDKNKAKNMYLKAMRLTAFITFPLLGGLIVFAEQFTEIVFGKQWLPMVITLQLLSILSLVESVFVFTTSLFYSQGATKLNFKISVLFGITNITVFYFGSQYSIETVALLLIIVYFIFLLPKVYYATKLIDLRLGIVFSNILRLFLFNSFAMFLSYFIYEIASCHINYLLSFILGIFVYILIFISLNLFFNKTQFKEFTFYISNINKN
jgi:PST family polysaccharide transporter